MKVNRIDVAFVEDQTDDILEMTAHIRELEAELQGVINSIERNTKTLKTVESQGLRSE